MQNEEPNHVLPLKLEKLLAALSAYFEQQQKDLLQRIIVNSTYHLDCGTNYDNWDGGTWGHTLTFNVPASLFYKIVHDPQSYAQEIRETINKFNTTSNEWIHEVNLEIQDGASMDTWRKQSGLLLEESPLVTEPSEDDLERLWSSDKLRVFLSHKSESKIETAQLKERLEFYGISCFVAHDDIEPTKAWQDEIEKALFSMNALVSLMTEQFHDSHWTDQEIGVAIGRGVPVLSVRLGTDPYGFIGKYQAISGFNKNPAVLARDLLNLFLTNHVLEQRAKEALVYSFCNSRSYEQANTLITLIDDSIDQLPQLLVDAIKDAPNRNTQVNAAYGVKNRLPNLIKRFEAP